MVATTTPPSTEHPPRIAVAYSGGRDSTALLHATARMAASVAADMAASIEPPPAPVQVLALHVHHGLNPQADGWLAHAQAQCARWAEQGLPIELRWQRVPHQPGAGESIEAWARRARYQALADMALAAGCDTVLLAHHQGDQAETFLLQAIRGAGVAGLAAMPRQRHGLGVTWWRPWLAQSRSAIEAYLAEHQLSYIDDDSNASLRYARNRLRLTVWPALAEAGAPGQAVAGLAQAAAHQADLLACHEAWLAEQLPQVTSVAGTGQAGAPAVALQVATWRSRPPEQQRELLRAWFLVATGQRLPRAWVERLQAELGAPGGHGGTQPGQGSKRWPVHGPAWRAMASHLTPDLVAHEHVAPPAGEERMLWGELRLYRGQLRWAPAVGPAHEGASTGTLIGGTSPAPAGDEARGGVWLSIEAPGDYAALALGGVLRVRAVEQGGVPLQRLSHCHLRPRSGGERFQLTPGGLARSLKKQFQSQAVPAWERDAPLLWAGNALVWVSGLGCDARVIAQPGEPQVQMAWLPRRP